MRKTIIDRERVDLLMKRSGINTYIELAQKANLHPNTLTKVLAGSKWQSDTLDKIAMVFECNPIDLLSADGFPSPNSETPVSHFALLN